jgi:hypothetical protein
MRQLGDLDYIWAMESHSAGYPHWHVMLNWRDKMIDHYVDQSGKWRIKDRKFWALLKSCWLGGNSDIQVVKDSAAASYMAKYLSKGLSLHKIDQAAKVGCMSDTTRKEVLGTVIAIMSKSRQFGCSQGVRDDEGIEQVIDSKVIIDDFYSAIDGLAENPERELALMTSLNNLRTLCPTRLYMIADPKDIILFNKVEGTTGPPLSRMQMIFRSKSYCTGCSGCKFSDMVEQWLRLGYQKAGLICPNESDFVIDISSDHHVDGSVVSALVDNAIDTCN